jgi:serine/threonine protein kinase
MTEEGKTRYIGPFLLGRTLGSGSNGKVKLGYHKHTGYKVAIKIIDKETLEGNKDRKRKMEREIAILVRN